MDAERFAPRRQALEQRGDGRDREAQPVARTRRIRLARGGDEAGDMRLLLDRSGRCRSCARGARSPRCRLITRTVVGLASSVSGRRTWVCGIE